MGCIRFATISEMGNVTMTREGHLPPGRFSVRGWSSPMDVYSLPSSLRARRIFYYCSARLHLRRRSRRLPFKFVSTRLTRECVELKDCFGVSPDRDDPVGDGGEDTTRWGGSIICHGAAQRASFVPFPHADSRSTRMRPQSVVAALQQVGQISIALPAARP